MEELEAVVAPPRRGGRLLASGDCRVRRRTRVEYFQEHQDFFRMYVDEIGSQVARAAAARTLCGAMIDRQTRILERLIAAAVERGEIRDVDPAAAALAVFDMTRGLVARQLLVAGTERHGARRGVPHRPDLDRPPAGAKEADVMNVRSAHPARLLLASVPRPRARRPRRVRFSAAPRRRARHRRSRSRCR